MKPPQEKQKNDSWTQSENDSQAVLVVFYINAARHVYKPLCVYVEFMKFIFCYFSQIPQDRNYGFGSFFSSDPLEIHKFFEQKIDDIMKRFSSSSFFPFDDGNNY